MLTAKRVLLLVTQAEWGGVQSFLVHFATDLMKDGCEVLLAAGGEGRLFDEAAKAGVPTKQLAKMTREIHLLADWQALGELQKLIAEFKPDAVHLNSSKMGVLGAIAAATQADKAARPWTVYRIGGWSFLEPIAKWKRQLYRLMEQWSAQYKDVIVTVHPGDESLAQLFGILPRHQLVTIPNGLDVEHFSAGLFSRAAARKVLGITENAFVFGTVANAYATKGLLPYLDVLENVLEKNPAAVGVIVGGGPELEMLKKKRERLKNATRIILTGERADAAQVYHAFDAFVLPSRKEGMPWALLEAMASGLPCIATDVGAQRWMFEEDGLRNGVIVPAQDAAALEHAMTVMHDDTRLRAELGAQAKSAVERRFRWSVTYAAQRAALERRD